MTSESTRFRLPEPITVDQAAVIAGIASGADSSCHVCAARLARDLKEAWPQHDWAQLVAVAGDWERELIERNME